MCFRGRIGAAGVLLVAMLVGSARGALPFDRMFIFGDSLSDVGNLFLATFGTNPSPAEYWKGRSSNGPVWVEYLAPRLGLAAPTAILSPGGGNDFAFRGAFSVSPGLGAPCLDTQVESFVGSDIVPGNTDLFTVWCGANDFIFNSPNPATVASNVLTQIRVLKDAGAKQFLVMNLPPMGLVPEYRDQPQQVKDQASAASMLYNATLHSGLDLVRSPDVSVTEIDVYGLFQQMVANPAAYGLTNVTDDFPGPLGDPAADGYLFWDSVHPTTAGHRILAEAVYAQVVPEPAGLALFALVGGWLILRRRRLAE